MREKRKMTRFPLLRFTTHNISLLNYLTDCTVCEGIQVDQCYLTDIVYLVPPSPHRILARGIFQRQVQRRDEVQRRDDFVGASCLL